MELRARINAAMKQAMRDKATARLSTVRLINAAIKDRDIAARSEGNDEGVDDAEVLAILGKMTRQRQESARTYEEAGRFDLSERELAEIKVIEEFLPRQLSQDEIETAIAVAVDNIGASSIRDMGKVMGALKAKYIPSMLILVVGIAYNLALMPANGKQNPFATDCKKTMLMTVRFGERNSNFSQFLPRDYLI